MNEVFENLGRVPIGTASAASTLSSADVEAYWNRMCTQMTVDHVAAWIEHSVQLPQFVDNFRRAAITGCDFPALDSQALQHDLAITSQLHQKQIIRAIQMKLLAVGDGALGFHCFRFLMTWTQFPSCGFSVLQNRPLQLAWR
jgi:hypothetical protein